MYKSSQECSPAQRVFSKQCVAKLWQTDRNLGFLLGHLLAGWTTTWCMHTEARSSGGTCCPKPCTHLPGHHTCCMWCWRKKPSADTSFQQACCLYSKEMKQQGFCRADACCLTVRKICLMVAFVFKHEAKMLAYSQSSGTPLVCIRPIQLWTTVCIPGKMQEKKKPNQNNKVPAKCWH